MGMGTPSNKLITRFSIACGQGQQGDAGISLPTEWLLPPPSLKNKTPWQLLIFLRQASNHPTPLIEHFCR
jgi:hypothetical protein